MRRTKGTFKFGYFIYVCCLSVVLIAAVLYVNSLLKNYEASQPERQVEAEMKSLSDAAQDGTLWNKLTFPETDIGRFEENIDLKSEFTALLASLDLEYTQKPGAHDEDKLIYSVRNKGFELAEITLHAAGEPETKLAVFTSRRWETEKVDIVLEKHDYKLSLPRDFSVSLNGISLSESDGVSDGKDGIEYTANGIYLRPRVVISDTHGNLAEYSFKGNKIVPVLFNYSLSIPASLTVEVNGEVHNGEPLDNGTVRHDIRMLTKPEVRLSDLYGNMINYDGENELPLTYMKIVADSEYTVQVSGREVPAAACTEAENPDYAELAKFVADLPKLITYDIALLKADAEISVKDRNGEAVEFDKGVHLLDLTDKNGLDTIPENISSEINVIDIAEKWSLFMSKDLQVGEIIKYIIPGSYQYDMAWKYANGIDITFTSNHTLLDPPFTNESVSNYTQITDTCFSVDVKLDKNMRLEEGNVIVDSMSERMFFVKYDSVRNGITDSVWMLAGMKGN